MADEHYDNIFDAAKKSSTKKEGKRELPPKDIASKAKQGEKEVNEMLAEMKRMSDDLNTRIQDISEKNGITVEKVLQYLENPSHFSQDDWQNFQKAKKNLINHLQNKDLVKLAPKQLSSQERKSKLVGSRKKWIQM